MKEDTSKCDIIDIANEEMKKIKEMDEFDKNYSDLMRNVITDSLITAVATEKYEKKQDKFWKTYIQNSNIKDIRISGKYIYIKTNKTMTPKGLANILKTNIEKIETVPINGKYNFYMIDAYKWYKKEKDERDKEIIREKFLKMLERHPYRPYRPSYTTSIGDPRVLEDVLERNRRWWL